MTSSDTPDLCHVTVIGPQRVLDLALPAYVALAELQPGLVRLAGDEHTNSGSDVGGWVLQRLGEEPLDVDLTSKALGLRDGDTIYLRPADAQLPPADFDDIADGVATAVRDGPGRWRSAHTGAAALLAAAVGVVVGAGLILTSESLPVRVGLLAALALVSGVAAVLASPSAADGRASAVLGVASVASAGLLGYHLAAMQVDALAPALVTAAATGLCAVCLLAFALPPAREPAVGAVSAVLLAGIAAVATLLFGLSTVGLCGVALVGSVAAIGLTPRVAAWIARLRIPPLPASLDQLLENSDPQPGPELLERAAAADRHVAAIAVGLAAVAGGALIVLGTAEHWTSRTSALVGAVALLLQARAFIAVWPRAALITAGIAGLAGFVRGVALGMSWPDRSVLALLLVLCAVGLAMAAKRLEGLRLMPRWGWFGDLLQSLAVLSLLPLSGAEWGLYAWAYSVGG